MNSSIRTESAGTSYPSSIRRRTFVNEAVSTSVENVERGSVFGSLNPDSIKLLYSSFGETSVGLYASVSERSSSGEISSVYSELLSLL